MGPADGIKVLDLSRYGPGRYSSMILADFGAEVVTVDTPRFASELPSIVSDDTNSRYLGQNRNKRSIAVNLKTDEGKTIVLGLAAKADVIMETFRPGVTKRLGVDYDTINKINPRVVYCSISSFGQDGPYAQRAAHDLNFMSLAGVTGLIGPQNSPPMNLPIQIGDLAGGTSQATIAILAALLAREKTGKGQYIDVSMTDGVISYLGDTATEFFLTGQNPERAELPTGVDAAWMNIYQAKDGKWFTVGCLEPWLWANLCRLAGKDEFFELHSAPIEMQKKMYRELSEVFLTKDRDEWVELLDKANVAVSPVCTFEETFTNPQIKHRQMVVEVEHPKVGRLKLLNTPYKFSNTPAGVRTRPPLYGEHTEEVLSKELGYSKQDIERLRREQIIE